MDFVTDRQIPLREMPDGSSCWCISVEEPHEGWTHSPMCERLRFKQEFVTFPLKEFQIRRALWATNYFVLWPIGLALAVTIDGGEITGLDVREWTYQEGDLGETINLSDDENEVYFNEFMQFLQERLLGMKPAERKAAMKFYEQHAIATPYHLMMASRGD